jgi:hypothetical protein
MTQDEIIEMLRASCDKDRVDPEQNGFWVIVTDELVAFANLVAQHEREACAKLVQDSWMAFSRAPNSRLDITPFPELEYVAKVIRAKGQA